MGRLHEILAVEKTVTSAAAQLVKDTADKFGKEHFFTGEEKSLSMIVASPEAQAEEAAARTSRQLATTVHDTLEFMFQVWSRAEDVLFMKNVTNTKALADVVYRGKTIATAVPVDELMGLESRLEHLRENVIKRIPTLDAAKAWRHDETERKGVWIAEPERTTKTAKIMVPVVLYAATDKHPAQVKEATRDDPVGTFTRVVRSGAATAVQKSEALLAVDDLIAAVKQARMRANAVEVDGALRIADSIVGVLMEPFK